MIYSEYPCHIHLLREKQSSFTSKIGLYEFFKEQIHLCERAFDPYIIQLICKKLARGKSLAEIASEVEMEESEISGIYETASTCGPDYDPEEVKKKLHLEKNS